MFEFHLSILLIHVDNIEESQRLGAGLEHDYVAKLANIDLIKMLGVEDFSIKIEQDQLDFQYAKFLLNKFFDSVKCCSAD